MHKKMIRLFGKVLLLTMGLVAAYFLIAFLLSLLPASSKPKSCSEDHRIFVASNGVHLDFILPRNYLNRSKLKVLKAERNSPYLAFGWGDRQFYLQTPQWEDLEAKVALRSLFLNTESAIHLSFYEQTNSSWTEVKLCRQELDKLTDYIWDSFEKNAVGSLVKIDAEGYSRYDQFYEAEGNYNLFMTSNEWVNRGLNKAGRESSVWSPFEFGVIHQLEKQNKR